MADKLKLPVGIEDFREIRQQGFYYIDKTSWLNSFLTAELVDEYEAWKEANSNA